MKKYWFIKVGWMYVPVSAMGILFTIATVIFMIPISIAVVRNAGSVTDSLYQLFVYGTCTMFWWKWVAAKTSNKYE